MTSPIASRVRALAGWLVGDPKRLWTVALVGSAVAVVVHAHPAAAQTATATGNFLDVIANEYQSATSGFLGESMQWAYAIFAGLLVLELAWSAYEIVLNNRDLEGMAVALVFRIVSVGAAIFLLSVGPTMIRAAMNDFINIGSGIASAGGAPQPTDPDGIWRTGVNLVGAMFNSVRQMSWTDAATVAVPAALGALALLIGFGLAAAQLLMTWIQVYITVGAGAFLLGFIGSRWTMPFAERYPAMLLQSGLKLIAVLIVVGVGNQLAAKFLILLSSAHAMGAADYIQIGVGGLVYGLIVWNLPAVIAAMAGATPALNASSIAGAAASGAASLARGAAAGAGGGGAGAGGSAGGAAAQRLAAIARAKQTD